MTKNRIKVIIPQPEIWYQTDAEMPDYVVRRMVGARIGYVITNVDRGCRADYDFALR